MKTPEFFNQACAEDAPYLFKMLWPILEYEAMINDAEFVNILSAEDRACSICGSLAINIFRYSVLECPNDDCLKTRRILGLSDRINTTWPQAYKAGSKERAFSYKAINEVVLKYGTERSFNRVPRECRLDAAKQAAALFIIYKCKGEINGKARI